jgi:hypothetical protein
MRLWSETVNDGAGFDAHRFGHAQQGMQADPLFTAFDFTDVNWMQISFFCQLFLRQPRFRPVMANGFSQDFKLFRRTRHRL